jgi:hypothetical protein
VAVGITCRRRVALLACRVTRHHLCQLQRFVHSVAGLFALCRHVMNVADLAVSRHLFAMDVNALLLHCHKPRLKRKLLLRAG